MMNQSAAPPVRPSEDLAPDARRRAEIVYAAELLAWALRFGHERDLEAAVQEVVERAECHGCQAAAVTAAVTEQPIWRRAEKRLLVRLAHALLVEPMEGIEAMTVVGEVHDRLADHFAADVDASLEQPLDFDLDAWVVSTGAAVDTDKIVEAVAAQRAAKGVAPHVPPEVRSDVVHAVLRALRARPEAAPAAPAAPLTRADAESCLDAIEGIEPPLPRGERAP